MPLKHFPAIPLMTHCKRLSEIDARAKDKLSILTAFLSRNKEKLTPCDGPGEVYLVSEVVDGQRWCKIGITTRALRVRLDEIARNNGKCGNEKKRFKIEYSAMVAHRWRSEAALKVVLNICGEKVPDRKHVIGGKHVTMDGGTEWFRGQHVIVCFKVFVRLTQVLDVTNTTSPSG